MTVRSGRKGPPTCRRRWRKIHRPDRCRGAGRRPAHCGRLRERFPARAPPSRSRSPEKARRRSRTGRRAGLTVRRRTVRTLAPMNPAVQKITKTAGITARSGGGRSADFGVAAGCGTDRESDRKHSRSAAAPVIIHVPRMALNVSFLRPRSHPQPCAGRAAAKRREPPCCPDCAGCSTCAYAPRGCPPNCRPPTCRGRCGGR